MGRAVMEKLVNYKRKTEETFDEQKCMHILTTLGNHLIDNAVGEGKVFYMKMKNGLRPVQI